MPNESREQWLAEMIDILGVDREDVLEVAAMFFETIDERLTASTRAFHIGDLKELTRLIHGLKGDAANIGFKKISQLARVLEMQSREGGVVDFDVQFAALQNAVAAQKQTLDLDNVAQDDGQGPSA